MVYWTDLTYEDFKKIDHDKTLVILPVGSIEEHGPHLPLSSDTDQAIFVANKISEKIDSLILPPIYYGNTDLDDFEGTITVSFNTLNSLILDILKSVIKWKFTKILIISGHAGSIHMAAIRDAALRIVRENAVKIMFLSDYDLAYELRGKLVPENDSHAGLIETSRMMIIRPDLVKNNFKYQFNGKGRFMIIDNYSSIYPYGTLSDPTGANEEIGKRVNDYVIEKMVQLIKENFF
ncbi:MAG: creatininase family protein [Thermoplasmata archaeon]